MKRWAVFISGRGSNLQALLNHSEENNIVVVISSSATAPGILKARRAGVPVVILPKKIDWEIVQKLLLQYSVQRIFLAGFMKIVPERFVQKWQNKILNVHPSLLPEFPGLHAIEKSYQSQQNMGVTVHVVTAEMDAGPRLLQKIAVLRQLGEKNHSTQSVSLTLSEAEFLISISEQSLVRESVRRWN